MKRLASIYTLPWICLGDFNEILDVSEKLGGVPKDGKLLAGFQELLDDCGLDDLGFDGPPFTWCNKREGLALIQERLDRCVGNLDWKMLFPLFKVSHLDYWRFDHRLVLLECKEDAVVVKEVKRGRRFRFEECWVDNDECRNIISEVWRDKRGTSVLFGVLDNIQNCGS